ncbi:PilN domain-containing protein [Desulfopila aestuarii]|uniref:Type IV pilus assembly protein PilN n=1 Tax=Desulfopila aestuarii DSM 18488 TaxID=1121416 RepID=A0A1M7YH42_9BACT|nr:PilN domain-containing protein [Desulfopila aestuarii]SHO51974.1 type IV pilus assembly protein PilN [Desulfopila aestuarii DSM 18488]
MIRINLLPVRQLKKRAKARNQIVAVTIGFIFFLAALGAVAYLQTMKVSALQTAIADTNREIEKFKPVLAQIKQIEATQKELERKSAVIDKLKSDSSLTVRVLDEVANIIDNERMWLLDLNQQGGSLSLNGVALDNQTVAEFMDDLKLSPFVSNVELTDSSLRKIAGRDLKSFSLSCSVSQPAPPQQGENKQSAN